MGANLTLSEKIQRAKGGDPSQLDILEAITGALIASGTQAANITDAETAHALNATFSDTEVEAALNALGTKINAILAALDAFDITA